MLTLSTRFLLMLASAVLIFLSPATATSPELGNTPQVLLLHRIDLSAGKVADYVSIESEIANIYRDAPVPVYWVALQSVSGPPHILYFDGYDTFAQIEAAGDAISKAVQSRSDLARLQSDLSQLMQTSQAVFSLRREDLSYRLDRFDIVKFRYVRVTVIQLRSGFEQEFADAARAIRKPYEAVGSETPWAIFQVQMGMPTPTFVVVQLLTSLKEFDDAIEARKFDRESPFDFGKSKPSLLPKDAIASLESNLYSVNLKISNIPSDKSAALSIGRATDVSLYHSPFAVNPISGTTSGRTQQRRK